MYSVFHTFLQVRRINREEMKNDNQCASFQLVEKVYAKREQGLVFRWNENKAITAASNVLIKN